MEDITTSIHKTTLGHASALSPSKPKSLMFEASFIMIPEKQSKKIAIIISDLLLVIKIPRKTQRVKLSENYIYYLLYTPTFFAIGNHLL